MAPVEPKKLTGGAFGQFLQEKRVELQEATKGKGCAAVTKLASEKFKALSEEEKAVYQEKFVAAKQKYDEDMKAFIAAGGEKKARKSPKSKVAKVVKKKKDPNAPKQPAGGAYGCFLAEHRAAFQEQLKGQPVTAVTKLASAKWKELAATEKEVYEQEYQKKKEAYQEAMKSYAPPPKDQEEVTEATSKKRKITKEKEEKEAAKATKAEAKTEAKAAAKKAHAKAKVKKDSKESAVSGPMGNPQNVKLEAGIIAKAEKLSLTGQMWLTQAKAMLRCWRHWKRIVDSYTRPREPFWVHELTNVKLSVKAA